MYREQLKEWNRITRKANEMRAVIKFPYRYNLYETRINYLNVRGKRKVKVKKITP